MEMEGEGGDVAVPAPVSMTRQSSADRAATCAPIWEKKEAEDVGPEQAEMGPPPPMPVKLKRQTTADRARFCEDIWEEYRAAIEALDDEEGAYGPMEDLVEAGHYYASQTGDHTPAATKAIMKEVTKVLPQNCEVSSQASMFVRFDESRPQFTRACLTGVEGTPYSNGVFVFDFYFPADYPNTNCLCNHVTAGQDQLHANNGPGGFSPNLHSGSGTVCLSLLGTWSGAGWEPGTSNSYQVMSSILWSILGVDHPYFNEPSYGYWEDSIPEGAENNAEVIQYDEEVKWGTIKFAILGQIKSPPKGFERVVHEHFRLKRKNILSTVEAWIAKGSDAFKTRVASDVAELKTALDGLMSVEDAEKEVRDREEEVAFIQQKMEYLQNKVAAAGPNAETKVPKAYRRLQLGPGLLEEAMNKLASARSALQNVTSKAGTGEEKEG